MMEYDFDWVENIVGKGECWLPAFSTFPNMFSKVQYIRVTKSWDCVAKNYNIVYFSKTVLFIAFV